jgi:hypothetical protein
MEKTFCFIDGTQPDKTSKRLMRQHVMKGKNAGKKFHRRSRLGLRITPHQPKTITAGDVHQEGHCTDKIGAPSSTINRNFGDTIFTSSIPVVEINPHSLNIINQCEDTYIRVPSTMSNAFSSSL